MGIFDQTARFAMEGSPSATIGRVTAPAKVTFRFREWLDTRTLPRPGGADRTADLVAARPGMKSASDGTDRIGSSE